MDHVSYALSPQNAVIDTHITHAEAVAAAYRAEEGGLKTPRRLLVYDWGMGAFRASVIDISDASVVEKAHVEDTLLGSAILDEVTLDLILSDVQVREVVEKNERLREWVRVESVRIKVRAM